MENSTLIAMASALLRPHEIGGRLFGDVGAVVLSESGQVYEGVCVDTASWGLCAERSAMAAMITAGEYRMRKVVAVWRDPATQALHVLPPCGVCREFMRQVDPNNLQTEIILGSATSDSLAALLPHHAWPPPLR